MIGLAAAVFTPPIERLPDHMADTPRRTLRLETLLRATARPPRAKWLDERQAPREVPSDWQHRMSASCRPARDDQVQTPQGKAAFARLAKIEADAATALRVVRERMPSIVPNEDRTVKSAAAERAAVARAHYGTLRAAAQQARLIADEARGASYRLGFETATRLEEQTPARVAQLAEIRAEIRLLSKVNRERVLGAAVRDGDIDVLEAIVAQPPTLGGDPIVGLAGSVVGATDRDTIAHRFAGLVNPELAAAHGELHALARAAATQLGWTTHHLAQAAGFAPPAELDAELAEISRGGIGSEWSGAPDARHEQRERLGTAPVVEDVVDADAQDKATTAAIEQALRANLDRQTAAATGGAA